MHIHNIVSAAWRQSTFMLFFLNSRGGESPVCSAAPRPPAAPQEVNRQTAAGPVLPRPLSRPLGMTAVSDLHCDHTHREHREHGDPWPRGARSEERQHRVPLVWVLTWMGTQSGGGSCRVWNREDPAEILIRCDATPGGNNHNKTSISSAICCRVGGGGKPGTHCQLSDTTRAFLSVITLADKDRKHCPVLPYQQSC